MMPSRDLTTDVISCCGLLRRTDAIATLTDRECEVFVLLGTGEPNRAVARRLSISERTVKAHVKSILNKLDVRTRLEAAIIAVLHHRPACSQCLGSRGDCDRQRVCV